MATTTIKLKALQQQLPETFVGYRINNNGAPVVYDQGVNAVGKTFRTQELSQTKNIYSNNPIFIGTGFNNSVTKIEPYTVSGTIKYIVSGFFTSYNGTPANRLVTLLADGSIDPAWINPTFIVNTGDSPYISDVIYVGSSGMFITGAFTAPFNSIAKLNLNGTLVSSFNPGTGLLFGTAGSNIGYGKVLQLTSGSLLVGGQFNRYNGIGRNNLALINTTTGAIISGFTSPLTTNETVNALEYLSGNAYVGVNPENSLSVRTLHKISATTGVKVSDSFNTGNGFQYQTISGPFYPSNIYGLKIIDGSLFVTGRFTRYRGVNAGGNIMKLNISDGSKVTAFNPTKAIPTTNQQSSISYGVTVSPTTNELIVYGSMRFGSDTLSTFAYSIDKVSGANWGSPSLILSQANTTTTVVSVSTAVWPATPGSQIIVGGSFFYGLPIPATQSQTTVPIGATSGVTLQSLYENLTTFNTKSSISYSITGDTITAIYTSDGGAAILVDNVVDIPDYLTITISGAETVSPIIVQTRSPHFVNVPFSGSVDTVAFDLRMYSGNFNSDSPVAPNYSITKSKIRLDQTNFYIDMAPLVRDFLECDVENFLEDTGFLLRPVGITETSWTTMQATLYSGSTVVDTYAVKYLGFDGFGYPEQGANPQPPKVLMTNNTQDVWSEGNNRIYVNIDGLEEIGYEYEFVTPPLIPFPPGGLVIFTGSTTVSNQYIQSLKIVNEVEGQPLKWVEYGFYYSNGEYIKKRFNFIPECRYDVKELYFKNKHGFLQTMTFFKKSSNKYEVDSKTFNRSILTNQGTFNPRKHSKVTYLVDAKEELTLNTGFVQEYMNDVYKELILSDEIYMNDNGVIKPVNLVDKGWAPKTRNNDKLIDYTITVEVAHNVINKIR